MTFFWCVYQLKESQAACNCPMPLHSVVLAQLFVQLCSKMILLEQGRLYIYNLYIYL